MKTRRWYACPLVFLLAVFITGLVVPQTVSAGDHENCRVAEDVAIYDGQCTRCQGEDPCGWNCHGATSHALGGKGGNLKPEDLGLRWGERYPVQPLEDYGRILSLAPCDIVVFGIEVPDPPPNDFAKVTGFAHSAVATGNGTEVWEVGENPVAGTDCVAGGALHLTDVHRILVNPTYGWKCVVFPASAFGNEPERIASSDAVERGDFETQPARLE